MTNIYTYRLDNPLYKAMLASADNKLNVTLRMAKASIRSNKTDPIWIGNQHDRPSSQTSGLGTQEPKGLDYGTRPNHRCQSLKKT